MFNVQCSMFKVLLRKLHCVMYPALREGLQWKARTMKQKDLQKIPLSFASWEDLERKARPIKQKDFSIIYRVLRFMGHAQNDTDKKVRYKTQDDRGQDAPERQLFNT